MLLYLGSDGHGDRSARLFGGHKGFYDGQRPPIILSAGFWLVKITNLLCKQNISFAWNVDWKKNIRQRIASLAWHTFAEWRSTFIHSEQMSLYNFIISRKKRDSNIGIFLWNLWNFQEQWWLLLKTRNIIT